jgi:hypothetical protein
MSRAAYEEALTSCVRQLNLLGPKPSLTAQHIALVFNIPEDHACLPDMVANPVITDLVLSVCTAMGATKISLIPPRDIPAMVIAFWVVNSIVNSEEFGGTADEVTSWTRRSAAAVEMFAKASIPLESPPCRAALKQINASLGAFVKFAFARMSDRGTDEEFADEMAAIGIAVAGTAASRGDEGPTPDRIEALLKALVSASGNASAAAQARILNSRRRTPL